MKNAILHLEKAAAAYRSMSTPDEHVTTEQAAKRNAELAEEFKQAAEALRKMVPNAKLTSGAHAAPETEK